MKGLRVHVYVRVLCQAIEGEDGLVRPVVEESEWKEIPMCTYRRRKGFKVRLEGRCRPKRKHDDSS